MVKIQLIKTLENVDMPSSTDYPSCCLGKVKVESIDDEEEMQIMDEAFDILGFKWYAQLASNLEWRIQAK